MGLYTDKTSISRAEYVTLAGLLAIGQRHQRETDLIVTEVARILGEREDNGHANDAVNCDYSVDQLLSKSGIVVEPD